jgi:hypothetical protein
MGFGGGRCEGRAPCVFRAIIWAMWRILALGLLCGGVARAGNAQAAPGSTRPRLSGTVWDSTLSAPLSGASVQAVRADDPTRLRTTTTDVRGSFRLDSLAPGDYAVVVYHPRLDSLGIELLTRGVTVRGDNERVALPVPSARTLIARVCGAESAVRGDGYLRGRLRDADQPGATRVGTVQAEWQALRVEGRTVQRQMQAIQARTDSAGTFVLCGIPRNDNLQLRAWSGADSTGIAELLTGELGIVLRDLYTGRVRRQPLVVSVDSGGDSLSATVDVLRGSGEIRGRVQGAGERPLANAQLTVWGTGVQALSSERGSFVLSNLPTGTHTLDVRALGYRAIRQVVDIVPGDSAAVTVSMMRTTVLDTVRVQADGLGVLQRQLADFESRRRSAASGRFFGPDDLAKRPPMRAGDVFVRVPGVRVVPNLYGERILMRGASFDSWCTADVWIDGMRAVRSGSIESMVAIDDVRAIEVYARGGTVPAQFTSFSGCGVILMWTGPRR